MNEIERQILENQLLIMEKLDCNNREEWKNTLKLLFPEQRDEECSDGLPKEFVDSSSEDEK